MPEEEARYHLKRCVDSGLWIPNAKDAEKEGETAERTRTDEDYVEISKASKV